MDGRVKSIPGEKVESVRTREIQRKSVKEGKK